ncbi:phosphatase PAP2 family protein [Halococcus agarilyticus]|uniref:phosphatase PAP2 family protein n=1 Tax=Halococcus agarilyticus TaxID=1232219 RepID=UPI000B24678A|nr:phosphatase PAP2 family protein [Halococcus agarilyticus]
MDRVVAEAIAELREPLVTKVMTSVTGLGSAAAALVFLGLFHLAGWDDELDVAMPALVLTGVVVGGLMLTVQRAFPPHPVCLRIGSEAATTSFPSGHAASVTVFALIARRSDTLATLPVAAVAALVAVSRIYLGTHYVSDTIAGVLIGVVAFLVAQRVKRRSARPS